MYAAITGILASRSAPAEPFGTVLTLRFNEFPFVDSSALAKPLTSVNATMVPGLFGNAASFPGSNTRVKVETQTQLSTDFIIGGWVKFNHLSNRQFMMTMPDGPSWAWLEIGSGGNNRPSLYWGGGYITWSTVLVPDVWYHLCASRVGTEMFVFLNGSLDGSSTSASVSTSMNSTIWFGGGVDGNGFFASSDSLNGELDSWQIQSGIGISSSFALPATEV